MSVFEDSFGSAAGTLLNAAGYTPYNLAGVQQSANPWTAGTSNFVISSANRARANATGNNLCVAPGTPASTEYDVDEDLAIVSIESSAGLYAFVVSHANGSVGVVANGYNAGLVTASGPAISATLTKQFPGGSNFVIATVATGLAAGTVPHVTLSTRLHLGGPSLDVSAYLTRPSDGFYLKPDGTYQATKIAYASFTDDGTTYGAVLSTGSGAIFSYDFTGDGVGVHHDNFRVANASVTPSFTVSPSSFTAGTSGNSATATGTNTAWVSGTTFSLDASSTGNGASVTTNSVNVGAQTASLTIHARNTGGTTGTLSDSTDSATATLTFNSPTPPTASTLAFVSSSPSGPVINWPAFTGGNGAITYYVHRSTTANFTPSGTTAGTGTCIAAGATAGANYTDTSCPGTSTTPCYYCVVGTDTTPNSATTNQVGGYPWAATISAVFTGDSTLSGYSASTDQATQFAAIFPDFVKERAVTTSNKAVPSTRSSDWVSGQADYTAAVTQANSMGATDWFFRVGVNDAVAGVSAATLLSNIQNTITHAFADVATLQRFWVLWPLWCGGANAAYAATTQGYLTSINTLDNGGNTRVIGRLSRAHFAERQNELNADLTHPTTAGVESDAVLIASEVNAILQSVAAATVNVIVPPRRQYLGRPLLVQPRRTTLVAGSPTVMQAVLVRPARRIHVAPRAFIPPRRPVLCPAPIVNQTVIVARRQLVM